MPEQSLYPWLLPSWRKLTHYLELERIPQALLITGKAATGKRQLAEKFAASLLCESRSYDFNACGQCHACQLRQAQTHPDFIFLEPEQAGKDISIAAIRNLLSTLSLKPQFDGHRVILIDPADQLNRAAANAFLKGLEEPGERTTFLLVSDKPSKLPLTIRSRCQPVPVAALDDAVIQEWMRRQQIDQPEQLLALANGSPLKAALFAEKDYVKLSEQFFNDWQNLLLQPERVNVVKMVEHWLKQPVDSETLLEWLCIWLAQLVKLWAGASPQTGFGQRLQELKAELNLLELNRYYQSVLNARQLLSTQINTQLLLEQVLIEWSQMSNKHG